MSAGDSELLARTKLASALAACKRPRAKEHAKLGLMLSQLEVPLCFDCLWALIAFVWKTTPEP